MSVDPTRRRPRSRTCWPRTRTFPPDPAFTAQANATRRPLRRGRGGLRGLLGAAGARAASTGSSRSTRRSSGTCRSPSGSPAASSTSATTASTATSRNGLGDKVAYHWIGEPGDTRTLTYADLLREVSKTANALKELGVGTGDRVAIYMPMIPELPDRDARLRPASARRTRSSSAASRPRRWPAASTTPQAKLRHHRRRRLAARQAGRPQAGRGRGARADARRSSTSSSSGGSATPRRRHRDDGRPRRLVARHRRPPVRRLPAGAGRLRAHALPALHVGHDGQAQGHHAHDRRLPAGRELHPRDGLRHQARRRLLVRRRHRLGDRPPLHRLRAAGQRDDRASCTRARRTRPTGTAGGRSSRTTRSRSCTARRPRSAPS